MDRGWGVVKVCVCVSVCRGGEGWRTRDIKNKSENPMQ